MCGIVGYIGKRQATPIILEGLRRLEYRGYDSAGLALWNGKKIICVKVAGKVKELARKVESMNNSGTAAIGHTRWATHGEPSEVNAHPHFDCEKKIFVVHNGIVENYLVLKEQLLEEGHTFRSETDTEVIAHLIESFIKRGMILEDAIKSSLKLIKGAYALLVFSVLEPDKIIAAKISSPLRIGVGQDEFIIASDPTAIVNYTKEVITLTDQEVAVIDQKSYRIVTLDGNKVVSKAIEKIEWDIEAVGKEGFDHFMLKEIFEQPKVIVDACRGRLIVDEGMSRLGGLKSVEKNLRDIERIHIVACGTAYYAGLVGKYMLEEYAHVGVEVNVSSEFRYRKLDLDSKKDIVLIISQSGETADTLAVVKEANSKGILTLGIINVVGSTISRETTAGIFNHAGPEISVASTKVFLSQLTILALCSIFFGRMRLMSLVTGKRIAKEILELPEKVSKILKMNHSVSKIATKYHLYKNFLFLGRKYNYPIALEGALKLKEISYIHAEGLASGELKHGTLALINSDFPSVFICPQDSVYEKNISNMLEVKARKGKILAITTEGNTDVKSIADDVIYIPKTLEMLTPILSVIPLQLLAYHIAQCLHLDIDQPRNLAKSVTVE